MSHLRFPNSHHLSDRTSGGRRPTSPLSATACPPLDDDDLLWEILLRLPPRQCSLSRASLVCKRWRQLVSDPRFLRRFRAHHRKAPLLGVFELREKIVFNPVMDPPDRVTPERFSLGRFSEGGYNHDGNRMFSLLGCRHGRVLVIDQMQEEVAVCDPVTGEHIQLAFPPEFSRCSWNSPVNGTVLCADSDQGHLHGACRSSPFQVILMCMYPPAVCVYSSATGAWGNIISTEFTRYVYDSGRPAVLAGDVFYWLLSFVRDGHVGVFEFNLDSQTMAVIEGPPVSDSRCQIIKANDGGVGLAVYSYPDLQIWHKKVNTHDVATWVLWKTVDLHNVLGLPDNERGETEMESILGYAEEDDIIFVHVGSGVFMVQLQSMQSRRLNEIIYDNQNSNIYYPFTSFFTEGVDR